MTLNEWREQIGWDWERVAIELSKLCMMYQESPIYANRLWRLRTGKTEARDYEIRALCQLTHDEVDSYKEPD